MESTLSLEAALRLALIQDPVHFWPRLVPEQELLARTLANFQQQPAHPLDQVAPSHALWSLRSSLYSTLWDFCSRGFRHVLPLDPFWLAICSMDLWLARMAHRPLVTSTAKKELAVRFAFFYQLETENPMEEKDLFEHLGQLFDFEGKWKNFFARHMYLLGEFAYFEGRLTIKDLVDLYLAQRYGQPLPTMDPQQWSAQRHLDWVKETCQLYVRMIDQTLQGPFQNEWSLLESVLVETLGGKK